MDDKIVMSFIYGVGFASALFIAVDMINSLNILIHESDEDNNGHIS